MKQEKRKIAIIGAGAIGSLIGGYMARAGEDVTLIGTPAHMAAIEAKGLNILGVPGELIVNVKTAISLEFEPDLVFISSKTQDVEEICRRNQPLIKNIPVVMIQNGVRSANIAAKYISRKNIVSCILLLNARFMEPGKIHYVNPQPTIIGAPFGECTESIHIIQNLLGMTAKTQISHNIRGVQWTKLLINSISNSMDGMTGLKLGDYILHKGLREIAIRILREAMQVLNEAGVRLENLPSASVSGLKLLSKMPLPIAGAIFKQAMIRKGDADIISSTLQSIQKSRKTEIDYLNGEIVRLAEQHELWAPVNTKVVELIHEIEQTHSFYTPEKLVMIFKSLPKGTIYVAKRENFSL